MDIQARDKLYEDMVQHEENGDLNKVIDCCVRITNLDLPDLEKAVGWINAGNMYGKLKNVDRALGCFDQAIQLESKHNRYFAIEAKAAFLAEQGKDKESLELYQKLAKRTDLYVSDFQRLQENVETLQKRLTNR